MKISNTPLKDLLLIEPDIFEDSRGYFFESYNEKKLSDYIDAKWVQDNESKSTRGVLRGLHYQVGPMMQAKLVRSICGEIFDVAVDLRPDSPSYKKWYGIILSGQNKKQLYIPRGFAHGFLVLSEEAVFAYKCDNYYAAEHEGGIYYADQDINIDWPIDKAIIRLSDKDSNLPPFVDRKPL